MGHTIGRSPLLRLGFVVALATLACSACAALSPTGYEPEKLFIRDYTLDVSARHIAGTSGSDFETDKIASIRSLGNAGLVYSPNYIFVADPRLLVITSSQVALPSSDVVDEPEYDEEGKINMVKVLRKPLFVIQKATITYSVPGYTLAPVTLVLQQPIKSNQYELKLSGVSQVNELMTAFSADPARIGSVAGSMTIALDVEDMDPFARKHTFTTSRSVPFAYTYIPFRPETTQSAAPEAATPVPAPTATASPSPSPSPSPSATQTPLGIIGAG